MLRYISKKVSAQIDGDGDKNGTEKEDRMMRLSIKG